MWSSPDGCQLAVYATHAEELFSDTGKFESQLSDF
jgi:hypothetical protein